MEHRKNRKVEHKEGRNDRANYNQLTYRLVDGLQPGDLPTDRPTNRPNDHWLPLDPRLTQIIAVSLQPFRAVSLLQENVLKCICPHHAYSCPPSQSTIFSHFTKPFLTSKNWSCREKNLQPLHNLCFLFNFISRHKAKGHYTLSYLSKLVLS